MKMRRRKGFLQVPRITNKRIFYCPAPNRKHKIAILIMPRRRKKRRREK